MALPRIQRDLRDGQVVWIKRYTDNTRHLRMALLRQLARRLDIGLLLAPAPLDAETACATERGMIERLQALGVRVPAIVEAGPRELVLSDLGPTLAGQCRAAGSPEQIGILLAAGFAAIADLHRRGGYVSQAFSRNLTHVDGVVGFIDLEEDPGSTMTLVAAQARDTLLYVHSTARFLQDDLPRYRQLLAAHLQAESAPVREALAHSVRRLGWLPRLARPFGSRARGVALALALLIEQLPETPAT